MHAQVPENDKLIQCVLESLRLVLVHSQDTTVTVPDALSFKLLPKI